MRRLTPAEVIYRAAQWGVSVRRHPYMPHRIEVVGPTQARRVALVAVDEYRAELEQVVGRWLHPPKREWVEGRSPNDYLAALQAEALDLPPPPPTEPPPTGTRTRLWLCDCSEQG